METVVLRLFKAKNHLPLVYFIANNIRFYWILKNHDVSSLKDITAIDMNYICNTLGHYLPYDLPRYKFDSIEFDIIPKQNITDRQYREVLGYVPIKGYGNC